MSGGGPPKGRRRLIKLAVFAASSVVAVFLVELVLMLAGFPEEGGYTYDPSFEKHFKNIEFEYDFKVNSQGLRSPEIPLERTADTSRVFVVGDSYTEGMGVEQEQTFCALLDKDFRSDRSIDFINGGIRGQGPLHYARVFVTKGVLYDPAALLICLHVNDPNDTPPETEPGEIFYERRTGWKRIAHGVLPRLYILARGAGARTPQHLEFMDHVTMLARKQGLPQERIDAWKARLPPKLVAAVARDEFHGPHLSYGLLRPSCLTESIDIDTPAAEAHWRAMVGVLRRLVEICREREVEVGVVYIPGPVEYDIRPRAIDVGVVVRPEWLTATSEIQKRLTKTTAELKVPYLDLTATFRRVAKEGKILNYHLDGHWNPEGHRLAAQEIGTWLDTGKVFSFRAGPPPAPR